MQAGQSNTLVAVRLRPLLNHDREHVEVAKVRRLEKKATVSIAVVFTGSPRSKPDNLRKIARRK